MKDEGFVLVAMMLVLVITSVMFAVGWRELRPLRTPSTALAEQRLATIAEAVNLGYLAAGKFPARLDQLSEFLQVDVAGQWASDPHGVGKTVDYRLTGKHPIVAVLTSRGADGQLGTGDDLVVKVDEQDVGRQRSRSRLRVIRAAAFGSVYMTSRRTKSGTRRALRDQVRIYLNAQQDLLRAAPGQRAALIAVRSKAAKRIDGLRKRQKARPWPKTVVGRKGIIRRLGLDPRMASDGFGSTLIADRYVGLMSIGGDRRGGTVDDF